MSDPRDSEDTRYVGRRRAPDAPDAEREPTQVLRRDPHRLPPGYQPPQAWSQAPAAPYRDPEPYRKPAAPRDDPQRDWAPTQRPERFTDTGAPPRTPTSPPPPPPPRRRAPEPAPEPSRRRKRRHWGRRILVPLIILLVLIGGLTFYFDSKLKRTDALPNYAGRVGDTPGTNWLLVGSDSRSDLSAEQQAKLSTGDVGGSRTDTIMVLHIPRSGNPTMVSIPRDTYVEIPGHGQDKINAAFGIGGGALLVQTIETVTGIHLDHYAEIGFGGFAGVVDAVGGVKMCLDTPMTDPLAGIDLPAGCQNLTGTEALGFVRSRATALADLDRMNHQREFMKSLLDKATSATTFLNPLRLWPLVSDTAGTLTVSKGDHIWDLARLAWALRKAPVSTTVPIGGFENTDSGNSLILDADRAPRFFGAIANDEPIPADLLTTG